MRRHAKAPSAGSTSGTGSSRGLFGRAFAIRGLAGEAKGTSARASRLTLVLLSALALSLALGTATASALTYSPGTPATFCSGTGEGAGECGELKGIAVDRSTGNVYVVDHINNRVNQFDSSGAFVRAFGTDVIPVGGTGDTGVGVEVCTAASTCKAGSVTGVGSIIGNQSRGIAVDPQTHVVYVAAAAPRLVYYDGTNGAFVGQTEGNTEIAGTVNAGTPEKFANSTGVAVDASDSSQHYLYVAIRPGSGVKIDKLKISAAGVTAGSYVCQITGTATNTSINGTECGGSNVAAHQNGAFSGITTNGQNGGHLVVDASGNVFIAEATTRHIVSEFDKNGNYVTQFKPVVAGHPAEPRPEGVAALPNGNLLVVDDGPVAGSGGAVIQEFNPASISPAIPPAVASAAPLSEFGSGTIGTASGGSLGVASFGPHVLVADKVNKKIWKFSPPPTAPTVTTEAATAVSKFRATLNGQVNPNLANVTDCHFEYGTTLSYGATAPCVPSPGGGFDPVAVSASLSGLAAGTTYNFRLVATNSVGTVTGANLEVTTTLVNKPEVTTTPGATEVLQTTAKVAGTVNPNEVLITDCHVNYGTTLAYGSTAPCVPASPGAGPSPVNVTASLSGLTPNTTYHFQLEASNSDGTATGSDQQFKTLPDPPALSDVAVGDVTQVSASVSGKVNPNSANVTDCHIDYGTTTSYGLQKPCTPAPGAGSLPVDISAALTSLAPDTLHHFRVVAANAGGVTTGTDHSFITMPPKLPAIFTDGASPGLGQTFTMEGRVNPLGLAVADCYFAYGPTSSYGQSAPCIPSAAGLGTGSAEVSVSAATAALEPDTTYHYRLVGSSLRGTSQGKDRTFVTAGASFDACPNAEIRAEQGVDVRLLPDCLALEQVSPSKKANQSAKSPLAISADGSKVRYRSVATLGECPNVHGIGGDFFIGVRDPSVGWRAECVNPQVTTGFGLEALQDGFSPDFSGWFHMISTPQGPRYFQEGIGVPPTPISPPLVNLVAPPASASAPVFVGSSDDHSHVYLRPATEREAGYLAGDPLPRGSGEEFNVYTAYLNSEGLPVVELLPRDRDGKVWGGDCGARLGGMGELTGADLTLRNGARNQGAVSADGSRVYFSTRPDQPASGDCAVTRKERIMVREETPTGPKIEELISSECGRVSPQPLCSNTDGDDVYQGASVDQSRVYFTTTRQLDDADLDGGAASCDLDVAVSGCDLYLYDANRPAGERLIDVSAGDASASTPGVGASVRNSITAISADGSHAYFVARTVLTTDTNPLGDVAQDAENNLYAYAYPEEELSFVGTLASADGGVLFGDRGSWENEAYSVPIGKTDVSGDSVGGDGHVLLFNSKAAIAPDDTDGAADLYRYDAAATTLERISKAAPGGSDSGAFDAIVGIGGGAGTDYAEKGRWVSEDGDSVVFTTKESLLAGDTNGVEDSYLWRQGQLFHLPGSTLADHATFIFPIISGDGTTVAYHSGRQLVPADGDSVEDVYVLRPGGGFRASVEVACEGEACQGAPGSPPGDPGATSGFFSGSGNVKAASTGCPKGKRRVKRAGRVRCVKLSKHKKQASGKRAGAKQGGRK